MLVLGVPEVLDALGADRAYQTKRLLVLLTWLHRNRVTHGLVLPENILLNAGHHAATLLDWTAAGPPGTQRAVRPGREMYYPLALFARTGQTPATDIIMAIRTVIAVLGGDPATGDLPRTVAPALAAFLLQHAAYDDVARNTDAYVTFENWRRVVQSVFGPPKYIPFVMPRLN